jgi:ABC-type bacteriocin/lantibiotic exporter with double-glycine peptidase domain
MLCYTGCGPTCLSMVALHLNQDSTMTPVEVARYADAEGYYTDGVGSSWTLMSEGSWHFGLVAEEISVVEEKMIDRLEQGKPLIAALSAGDFTDSGHFIVISGYKDGSFAVNDPNSLERSNRLWDYSEFQDQVRNLWAISAPEPVEGEITSEMQ